MLRQKHLSPLVHDFLVFAQASYDECKGERGPLRSAFGYCVRQRIGTIGSGSYAGARFALTPGDHVLTTATPSVRFMAFSYGYAAYDSYALPLGMAFTRNGCQPTRTQPGDGVDNDCDGIEGEERANGIDDDGDGVKDEDLALERDPNAPNHAPTIASTTYGDFAGTMSFAIPGFDEDGDALSYRIIAAPAPSVGTASVNGERVTFTGTPPSTGAQITLVANDGHADSAPGTLTLKPFPYPTCNDPFVSTTNRCNDPPYTWGPEFVNQTVKVPAGQLVQFSSRASGLDRDLQPVHYEMITAPAGMRIDPNTGIVTWLVDSTMLGTYSIQYRLSDPFGGTEVDFAQVTVVAGQTNTPPVIDSAPITLAQINQPYTYTLVAHDAENQSLTYQLLVSPSAMTLNNATLSWLPTSTDVGEHSVLMRVNDSLGGSTVQSFSVTVAGSPLQFVTKPGLVAAVGSEYSYHPQVQRSIGTSDLVFDLGEHAPRGMLLDTSTGEMLWTPTADQVGPHEVEFLVFDQDGNQGTQFFSIEVDEFDAFRASSARPSRPRFNTRTMCMTSTPPTSASVRS